jgi:serine/threonine protein kinase
MLAGGGPWMGILGGVFTDKIIVQRLTDLMWVGHSSTEEDARVYRFGRVLNALRICLGKLQTYYGKIGDVKDISPISPDRTHPRFYPYPLSFTDENGRLVDFEYLKMLEENDPACVTYKAKISEEDIIVVKFVSRYSEEVHKFLAAKGHAPRLRYYGPLSDAQERPHESFVKLTLPGLSLGPMQMVVMDYVSTCKEPPADARQQLEVILETLHVEGYVFGDLRRQNILFDENNKVNLIDFDWAGPFDMKFRDVSLPAELQKKIDDSQRTKNDRADGNYVYYPLNLSKSVPWADGVIDLKPIRPVHDWDMLTKLVLQ